MNLFPFRFFSQEVETFRHSPLQIGKCFLKWERQFYLYALYNKNKPKSDQLLNDFGNEYFQVCLVSDSTSACFVPIFPLVSMLLSVLQQNIGNIGTKPVNGSFILYISKFFWKTDIFYPLMCIHICAHQWVRNVNFSEKFCLRSKWMAPKLAFQTLLWWLFSSHD